MNERTDLDRLLTAWLTADAPIREPEPLLGQVLGRTARTRRRPAWRVPERWFPVSTITTRVETAPRFPWRTVGAVALLILAAAVGAWVIAGSRPTPLPAPFGPAQNGHVAFSDGGDIVAVDGPTGKRTVLVGGPTADSLPWFSPNGARFDFVRGDPAATAELWAADADGANAHKLIDINALDWVEWSPQSDALAMTTQVDRSVITMVRADGSGSSVIPTGLTAVESPLWRPSDGGQLAFRGKDADGTWGLYVVDRDGSDIRHLALDAGFQTDAEYSINSEFYFMAPTWSPDGTKLMYHTLEPDPTSPAGPGFRIHIADISPAGVVTAERKLEFHRQADDEFAASWLPSGDGIVFSSLEGSVHRMMLADPSGTNPARDFGLVSEDWIDYQVSPDGRQVISTLKLTTTAPKTFQLTDLASMTSTPVTINEDYSWQRTAR